MVCLFLSSESQNLARSSGDRVEDFAPSVTALTLTNLLHAFGREENKQ